MPKILSMLCELQELWCTPSPIFWNDTHPITQPPVKARRITYTLAHSTGDLSTFINSSSRVPDPAAPISDIYSHRAVCGRLVIVAGARVSSVNRPFFVKRDNATHLIRILSILAPGVNSPNLVPRSCTKLNSTYRPRRKSCHRRSSSV
jgi:hypothetical protein